MRAVDRLHLTAALFGILICASLAGCRSLGGSAATVASSSVQRSMLTGNHTVTLVPTRNNGSLGSSSPSSLAAAIGPTVDSRTSEPTETVEPTVTSAGSCNPSLIRFDFEPVEPTYTYPYPQGAAVPSSCAGVSEAGTITMQVGDSVRMTVQQPGLQFDPLSATPPNLVKLSGDIILAEHPGTVRIYSGLESLCRLLEVAKSPCELLILKIGS